MYEPLKHEELFKLTPIGVRYICEHCNEGEMKVVNPPEQNPLSFFKHECSKCKGVLYLQKCYPYIEWNKDE